MTGFEAEIIGRQELRRLDLHLAGWKVQVVSEGQLKVKGDPPIDHAAPCLGRCFVPEKTILLSLKFVHDNDEAAVLDVVRHEVGHAAAASMGVVGHGPVWQLAVQALGGTGKVSYKYEIKGGKLIVKGAYKKPKRRRIL